MVLQLDYDAVVGLTFGFFAACCLARTARLLVGGQAWLRGVRTRSAKGKEPGVYAG